MKFRLVISLVLCVACQPSDAPSDTPSEGPPFSWTTGLPGSDFEGVAWEFERVAEDVYHARGTGNVTVMSNASIVINENDVLVVDSHVSPAAAASLINELVAITDKPVRYVVNSHYHFDHAHGNQIYPPEVEVIGHEFTRQALASGASVTGRTYARFLRIMSEAPGFLEGQEGLEPTPPNVTLSERMTLFRGGREIQLLFFGRGHTGGDIVTYLPAERVLMTGDLLLEGLPYMGDGFPADWPDTLEELKGLDFDVVLPGHGRPFTNRAVIDNLQAYLRDVWARVGDAHARGLSIEDAAEQVDLSDHADSYPQIQGPGVPLPTVQRIYELLDGEGSNE